VIEVTTKSGIVLVGRPAELYTGNCPPERPCDEATAKAYRDKYDAMTPEEFNKMREGVPREPGTLRNKLWRRAGQVYSYLEAKTWWTLKGCPVPNPEQLEQRRQICFACPKHDHERDGCKECGCGTLDGGSLAEKRGMATESCPDHPPRWVALV
jgi:hypothetical protein